MDPFFKYLMAGLTFVTIASVGLAGWQYSRASDADAVISKQSDEIVVLISKVVKAEADLAFANADKKRQTEVLTKERDQAVADAELVSKLLLDLQSDVGTERDAPSAPLWHRFEKTASPTRPMALPREWHLLVIIKGHVSDSRRLPDQASCIATAFAIADQTIARPDFDELRGHVKIVCSMASGRTA